MKSAIAIVSTPLHLIYLAEFVYKHQASTTEVIVLLKRETDRPQIERVLAELPHFETHWLILTGHIQNKFISVWEILCLRSLKLSKTHYDYGIFADYGRSILANVSCNDYYWLGDGTKLLHEVSLRGQQAFNRYKKQKLAEPLVRSILGKRLVLKPETNVFTPFNLEGRRFEKNDFEWLRSKYKHSSVETNVDAVYFFGSYFSERAGKPLLPDDLYLQYMSRIANYYSKKGMRLEYVPHRHESAQKLDRISNIKCCSIQKFEYPAEMEFLRRGEIPAHVASFFSTCLFHFNVLGVCQSITSFYADFGQSNPAYRAVAESIYSALRRDLGAGGVITLIDEESTVI